MPRIAAALTAVAAALAVATTLALAADTRESGVGSSRAALVEADPGSPAGPASAEGAASPAGAASAGEAASPAGRATITVRRSRYGRVIFDGDGRALYLFTRERTSRPRCYGDCAVAWPPFLTEGEPRAGRGARARLVGTTRRRDGSTQVTYRGRPLYYYVGDREPGQILCQNVVEFGGTWLVVRPNGRPVR